MISTVAYRSKNDSFDSRLQCVSSDDCSADLLQRFSVSARKTLKKIQITLQSADARYNRADEYEMW